MSFSLLDSALSNPNDHIFFIIDAVSPCTAQTNELKETDSSDTFVDLPHPLSLIRVSNVERFPCEFLFQGSSASTIDSVIKTDDCLKFCDAFQGQQRLSQIERVSKESGLLQGRDDDSMGTLERAFDKLGLRLKATQTKFKAEVLAQPKLNGDAQIHVKDGIWDMRRRKFHRGSRIHSFSVLRLSPSSIGHNDIESFLKSFESVWKKYGAQTSFSMSDHMESNIVDLDRARASPYSVSLLCIIGVQYWPLYSSNKYELPICSCLIF